MVGAVNIIMIRTGQEMVLLLPEREILRAWPPSVVVVLSEKALGEAILMSSTAKTFR